jgi:hypothetical protein
VLAGLSVYALLAAALYRVLYGLGAPLVDYDVTPFRALFYLALLAHLVLTGAASVALSRVVHPSRLAVLALLLVLAVFVALTLLTLSFWNNCAVAESFPFPSRVCDD